MNITKNIYYCWFGRGEKPSDFLAYLKTWQQYMPDYQIIEINEDNFDVNQYKYAKAAYQAKRYAFVSDCARIAFLQQYGGIYLDIDVELKKSLTPLLNQQSGKVLLSMEYFQYEVTGVNTAVIVSDKNCKMWQDLLEYYVISEFNDEKEPQTINLYISTMLTQETSFQYKDVAQTLTYKTETVAIVESKYLMKNVKEAYAVHHLAGSWTKDLTFSRRIRRMMGVILKKIIGRSNFERLWHKK